MNPRPAPDGLLEIAVPNRLCVGWVEENFLAEISAAWATVSGRKDVFRVVSAEESVQGELFTVPRATPTNSGRERTVDRRLGSLIDRYDFSNFVVGPGNQFGRAAAQAVAGQPGTLYNPFFLYGGVGLGKTHLANAIGNAILDKDPSTRVLFLSADTFTNQLIDAIARNRSLEFKNRMRRIEVLILDDVQFLAGRERTQEEFFHIFNALYDNGRQIVVTSDKFPNEISGLEERLCNRFSWGLVADIQAPDVETRVAILNRKAQDEGLSVPIEVASFIATEIDSNVRDLEGALTRLVAFASLNNRELSLELAKELLINASDSGPAVGLEEIARGVSTHFGLSRQDLIARRRTKKVAEARQVAMYIMRQHTGASFPAIGDFLGGRDHSTVVHACQSVERKRKTDPQFRQLLDTVTRMIGCA